MCDASLLTEEARCIPDASARLPPLSARPLWATTGVASTGIPLDAATVFGSAVQTVYVLNPRFTYITLKFFFFLLVLFDGTPTNPGKLEAERAKGDAWTVELVWTKGVSGVLVPKF